MRRNWIFGHTFCMNNPHWQSGGVIIFLCKYFIVISDILVGTFLHVPFLLVVVIRATWEEGIKIELQKKVHRRICVTDITFFDCTPSFLCHVLLLAFFVYSLPLSKWRTCWMVLTKIHNIATECILCDEWTVKNMKISEIPCNLILDAKHL